VTQEKFLSPLNTIKANKKKVLSQFKGDNFFDLKTNKFYLEFLQPHWQLKCALIRCSATSFLNDCKAMYIAPFGVCRFVDFYYLEKYFLFLSTKSVGKSV